jgi:cell division protein FtsL
MLELTLTIAGVFIALVVINFIKDLRLYIKAKSIYDEQNTSDIEFSELDSDESIKYWYKADEK